MKKILALLLIALSFSACEKDDICTEETTPRLIVEFYDISNNANLKSVLNLKVKGDDASDYIVFNTALDVTNPLRYLYTGNKISLPLKLDGTTTTYHLILNSTDTTNINEDILQISYTPENVFVSRACGYKTIFTLDSPGGVVRNDAATPDGFWIQDLTILTTNITTENETHIKVYF